MNSTTEGRPHERFGPPITAIVASILGIVAWLVFILLYALFWSKGFDLFQNVIVTVASLMITGLLIGAMWVIASRKWWNFRGDRL